MNWQNPWLEQKFREYYSAHRPIPPAEIEKREFGYGLQNKIDLRHVSFPDEQEFYKFLAGEAPRYISYSAALYERPDARPMPKKGFLGAELVFEFDAHCEHGRIVCPDCLGKAKQDTFRLIEEFLVPDFGLSKKEITVNFSGARGYHIHVDNDWARELGRDSRREIAEFITGSGVDPKKLPPESVWARKLAGARGKKRVEKFRETVLDIDVNVTVDISRLMRVPDTLHGGTGLLAARVRDLEKFDPTRDPVVFRNYPVTVLLSQDFPEHELKGVAFGPWKKGEEKTVPEYLAVLLACSNSAVVKKD